MAVDSDIPVSDNFQPAPGVDYGDTTPETPTAEATESAEAPKVEETPSETTETKKPEETVNDPAQDKKPDNQNAENDNQDSRPERPKKSGPIATLLDKKHEAERAANEWKAKYEAEVQKGLQTAASQTTVEATDDEIQSLVAEYGFDPEVLNKLVSAIRKGVTPQIPDEVQQLLHERQVAKQQSEEMQAFNKRVDSLAKTLPSEMFNDPVVREKLADLAYSTELAPDGEPYYLKELSELYFGYIKPEVEPGKVTAEASQGGTQTSTAVLDFEEIYNRDNPKDIDEMDSETFSKYNKWVQDNKEKRTPLKRS